MSATDNPPPTTVSPARSDKERFVAFAFAAADILVELNPQGVISFIDGATQGILGKTHAELHGAHLDTLIHPDDLSIFHTMLESLHNMERIRKLELRIHTGNNAGKSTMLMSVSGYKLPIHKNHIYLAFSHVTESASIDNVTLTDERTGLLKKDFFAEIAADRIRECAEKGEATELTLVNMPALNDLLGQLPGNSSTELLEQISGFLSSRSLGGDTASKIDDESYSIIHKKGENLDDMTSKLWDITRNADPDGKGIESTIATVDLDITELSQQDCANAILYTVTKFAADSGDAFTVTSLKEGYDATLKDTISKMQEFKTILHKEAYDLALQPIVNIRSGSIHHFEALVRLHKGATFSNPFEFITFAEQSGVINDFDMIVASKALEAIRKHSTSSIKPMIAVNLSGRSLSSQVFMESLHTLLRAHTSYTKQLIIEVTESAKISDIVQANNFLQSLRSDNVKCCLDDFGVGESSFEYLRHLEVDFIKIDGSYVRESAKTLRGRQMLKAMSDLCHSLRTHTIGEMVEDEKTAALLIEAGIQYGQGYLFGRPEINDDLLKLCGEYCPGYNGIMRAKKII